MMNAMYIDEWTIDEIRVLIWELEQLILEKEDESNGD